VANAAEAHASDSARFLVRRRQMGIVAALSAVAAGLIALDQRIASGA
jgi:hypothetical protein